MDYLLTNEVRVLAIDPTTKGLGYVVLEGPQGLIDWGIRQTTGESDADKNAACVEIVRDLIDRYRPHALVTEAAASEDSRRCERVRALLDEIRKVARERRVKVLDVTRERIRQAFAPKKDIIAAAIAGRFPELAPRLPRQRTLTMSEQYEMPVFDAMAFAQTFFHFRSRKQLAEERKAIQQMLR